MSHVDDGSLHAYLDGELSAVERTRLDTHLAECAVCRARLEEERALIERAGQLLGLATPPGPERAMPPLHQLRHPRPRLRAMVPLAWAATVVLALGVGWYARGGQRMAGIRALQDAAHEGAPVVLFDSGTVATAPSPSTSGEGPAAQARSDVRIRSERTVPAREEAAQAQERDNRPADALATRVPETPLPPRAEPPAGAAPPAPVRQFVPAPAAAGVETGGVIVTTEPKTISTDSARRVLGTTFALVPGLPVRRVRHQPGGPIEIEQQLDSATVITLFQWPEETAAQRRTLERSRAAAPSAANAGAAKASGYMSERLARYVRGMRVEIAGPIPVDSLSKLLERVQ